MPKIDLSGINFDTLKNALGESLAASLKNLITGAAEDLQNFGIAIAQDMILAVQEPDDDRRNAVLTELKAQAVNVAEVNRIRLNAQAVASFNMVFDTTANVLTKVLTALIVAAA